MKRPVRLVLLLLLIVAAVLIWFATRPEPVSVVVHEVGRGVVESIVANTRAGTVNACRRSLLAPAVGGQINALYVDEGDRVKRGDLLLELLNDDERAQVELAESEVSAAKARAEAACLQAEVAEREAQRLLNLRKSGAVSEERLDQAQTQAKAQRAECQAARAAVQVAQSRLGVARAVYARTRLTAPFDGVVAEINGELYEFVTPSPPGIPTLPVVDLIDDSCYYVSAPIDEVDAAQVKPGLPARVLLDAYPGRQFAGEVRRVADYIEEREKQARTVEVEVRLLEPPEPGTLLAGFSADVEIIVAAEPDALRVPTVAVQDGDQVFVLDPLTDQLVEREIQTGLANWDYTQITKGLTAGEQVVVSLDRPGIEAGAPAVVEAVRP